MIQLNASYWDNRYVEQTHRWDLGDVSAPLKQYINSLENKALKILIPGAGNAHEAEYLHQLGFTNVYVIDWSRTAINNIKKRVPTFPEANLLQGDFFDLKMTFDLILEQTFFCALNPELRSNYVTKMHSLLHTKGKLAGLLFDAPLYSDQPPFGGSKNEYLSILSTLFKINFMKKAKNSHESRLGRELIFEIEKTI